MTIERRVARIRISPIADEVGAEAHRRAHQFRRLHDRLFGVARSGGEDPPVDRQLRVAILVDQRKVDEPASVGAATAPPAEDLRRRSAAGPIRATRPDARFVVAGAPTIPLDAPRPDGIPFLHDRTHDVLSSADQLLTASGTATVEAALYGVPMVVTYWVNPLAALLVRPLLKVDRFAMVNLLAGRDIMPELYLSKAKPELMAGAVLDMLRPERRDEVKRALAEVRDALGGPGASRRAAEEIHAFL